MKRFLTTLGLLLALVAPALAATTVGQCTLYAGAGTGKAIATGAAVDECVKAAKAAGDYTVKVPVSVAADPAVIVLSGLPATSTADRTASIGYTVSPAGTAVWCRRDGFAPMTCPKVFALGAAAPLEPGQHTVDFFVGATPDVTKPAKSFTWTITAPTTPTTPPNPDAPTTGAKPLAALTSPSWEGNGQDVNYAGQTITGSDGVVRVQKMADGTYLMRTKQGDAKNWSGNRSELGWSGKVAMNPGSDYWFAFAFKPLVWGGGRQIFWQIHQDAGYAPTGCTGPTFEIQLTGALQINSVTGSTSAWTCNALLNSAAAAPAIGVWSKFVVHFRPGYLASQSPKTEVWKDGVLVYASTNVNTQPAANDYPKYGIYKWDDAWAGVNERSGYYTPLYFGQGVDLKASADAALAGIK